MDYNENQNNISILLKKGAKSTIVIGVILLLVGVIAVVYPSVFGKFTTGTIGVFLFLGGIIRLGFAIFSYSMGSLFLRYLYALLMIFAGIWVIMNPEMGLKALTLILAVYFFIDGISELALSFSLMPIGGGIFFLISGIVGIVIAFLIFNNWPDSSDHILGLYLGIKIIIDGLAISLTGNAINKTV